MVNEFLRSNFKGEINWKWKCWWMEFLRANLFIKQNGKAERVEVMLFGLKRTAGMMEVRKAERPGLGLQGCRCTFQSVLRCVIDVWLCAQTARRSDGQTERIFRSTWHSLLNRVNHWESRCFWMKEKQNWCRILSLERVKTVGPNQDWTSKEWA